MMFIVHFTLYANTCRLAHHGLGKVQSISEPRFRGTSSRKFAKLHFKREELTLVLLMK